MFNFQYGKLSFLSGPYCEKLNILNFRYGELSFLSGPYCDKLDV